MANKRRIDPQTTDEVKGAFEMKLQELKVAGRLRGEDNCKDVAMSVISLLSAGGTLAELWTQTSRALETIMSRDDANNVLRSINQSRVLKWIEFQVIDSQPNGSPPNSGAAGYHSNVLPPKKKRKTSHDDHKTNDQSTSTNTGSYITECSNSLYVIHPIIATA